MTTARPYTHACSCALPLIVGAVAIGAGPALALDVTLAGGFVLANLIAAEGVSRRFVLAAAHQDDGAGIGRLVLRQLTAIPLALVLMALLGPQAVALGLGCTVMGAVVHAVVQAMRAADVSAVAALEPQC